MDEPPAVDEPRPPRFARLEARVRALTEAAASWLPITLGVAIAPGIAVWAARHPELLADHLVHNRLALAERIDLLVRAGASLLLVVASYVGASWRAAVADGRWSDGAARALNRRLAFVLALPLLATLGVPGIEEERPFFTLLLIGLAAVPVGVSAAALAPAAARGLEAAKARAPWLVHLAPVAVTAMAVLYGVRAVELHLAQHVAFRTGAHDLGIYTNILWQSLEGNFLGCSFCKGGTHAGAHYDPILVLLSPTMLAHRGAETAIVLQTVWLASASIPVYLLGAKRGGALFGVALATVFLAHPAFHGVNLFDFHSMSLSVPLVLWAAYLLERRYWRRYAVALALLLLCREDMAIAASCLGLYAIVGEKQTRAGLVTIAVSAVWLAFVKLVAMPDPALLMENSEEAYEYGSYFRDLSPHGGGVAGIASTVFTNPSFMLSHLLREDRLLYVLQLLVPLAFLPLMNTGKRWVLLGYGMIFVLLASREAVFTLGFHYASTALPALFVLAAAGVDLTAAKLHERRGVPRRETVAFAGAAMLTAALGSSVAFGGLVPNQGFQAGWYELAREVTPERARRYRAFREMTAIIPEDAAVTADGFTIPHLATRSTILHWPVTQGVDWAVLNVADLRAHERAPLRALRRDPTWELIIERQGFALFRRR
ncbi:MAG TPA: DUF2079 domain-containing protein [Sandaracinaceae bacterium LLY-WYZ-13_1]|nr:DUF2079 domain-containing protein [Sandaracinaceae bacterium LLY-WYZ-13_1]